MRAAGSARIKGPFASARRLALVAAALIGIGTAISPSLAADASSVATSSAPPPESVRRLLDLLADPAVRAWLDQQLAATPPPTAAPPPTMMMPAHWGARRLVELQGHFGRLAQAVPMLPDELRRAWIVLARELQERGIVGVFVLLAGFIGLGFGAEWLFWRATRGLRRRISDAGLETAGERLRVQGLRLAFGIGLVAAFALGSVGAFLTFDWPPLLREIVLGYLLAFLALRLAIVLGRLLLAPGGQLLLFALLARGRALIGGGPAPAAENLPFRAVERFRIVPMSTAAAWYWQRRLALVVGWFAFGWVTMGLLGTLGVAVEVRRLVAYALGLGLLAIGLEIAWRRPQAAEAPGRRGVGPWLLAAGFVLLWLLWVGGAMHAFWLALVALGLPAAIRLARRSVDYLLRPPGTATSEPAAASTITAVCLERGLQALLIIGAAWLLAWAWGIDLGALTARETMSNRLLAGLLDLIVITLVADFLWHLAKAAIDRQIARTTQGEGQDDSPEARRQARLRTLLPILKNILFVVILATAVLMGLSALGVQIGPLLAGAGVAGVAIGFGAQTLVKDIISGMFFLLDDAFRVGEYIESGDIRGTVEAFSLRSVKLRHHRGYLHTVPFGALDKVTNYSRDWVIDKITVDVTFDTDLALVKKLVKQIGKELLADPELAPQIIETLKLQGVERYTEHGIQLRLKMMTRPGEQFVVRRRAYALIKQAFDEHGIQFARPVVSVGGGVGGATEAAAAGASLQVLKKPAA